MARLTQELKIVYGADAYHAWDEFYLDERRGGRGRGADLDECRHAKWFYSVAVEAKRLNVPPREFVQSAVTLLQRTHRAILPKELVSQPVLSFMARRDTQTTGRNQLEKTYLANKLLVERQPSDEMQRIALISPRMPLLSWFRVMYGFSRDSRVIPIYGAAAYSDMRRNTSLRKYCRTLAAAAVGELEKAFGPLPDDGERA